MHWLLELFSITLNQFLTTSKSKPSICALNKVLSSSSESQESYEKKALVSYEICACADQMQNKNRTGIGSGIGSGTSGHVIRTLYHDNAPRADFTLR